MSAQMPVLVLKKVSIIFDKKEENKSLGNNVPFTHRSAHISGNFLDPSHIVPAEDKFTQIITLVIFEFLQVEIRPNLAVLSPITSVKMLSTVYFSSYCQYSLQYKSSYY